MRGNILEAREERSERRGGKIGGDGRESMISAKKHWKIGKEE